MMDTLYKKQFFEIIESCVGHTNTNYINSKKRFHSLRKILIFKYVPVD